MTKEEIRARHELRLFLSKGDHGLDENIIVKLRQLVPDKRYGQHERKEPPSLLGKPFGHWTVLRYAGVRQYACVSRDSNLRHMYRCLCVCGGERDVELGSLLKGTSKSCGCLSPNNNTGRTRRENMVLRSRRRRARKAGHTEHFTFEEFEALKKQYGNRCLCCGRSESELISVGLMLVPDHVKALTDGGTDDIGNIQPLCHSYREGTFGGCNNSKGATFVDYRPSISPKTSADAAAVTDPLTVN